MTDSTQGVSAPAKRPKRLEIAGALLFVAALVAFATNPDLQKHKVAIDNEYRAKNKITGFLGAGQLLSETVTYHDYYLFSTTSLGNGKLSVGALGKVLVGDLDIAAPFKQAR